MDFVTFMQELSLAARNGIMMKSTLLVLALCVLPSCLKYDPPEAIEIDGQVTRDSTAQSQDSIVAPDMEGDYEFSAEDVEADLTIIHISDDKYHVTGMSFWGISIPGGPHIGELDFIALRNENTISWATGDSGYSILISLEESSLQVTEDGLNPDFGLNVGFSGTYFKKAE
jgi:hypothetical protein